MAANEITKIIAFVVSYKWYFNINQYRLLDFNADIKRGQFREISSAFWSTRESLTTIHIILDTFHNYVNAKTSFPEATLVLKICAY